MTAMLVQADARRLPLADGSVQTCITSPPYWGLRDYGATPAVWGGDVDCAHEWGEWQEKHDERERTASGKTRTTDRCYGEASRKFDGNHQKHVAGAFCRKCSAWLGCYGLEPTPDLYVAHTVEIFREVKRVLRDDGTLFLNLGDSYSAQPGQRRPTDKPGPKQASNSGSIGVGSRHGPGLKPKDLVGIPWQVAFALRADGWYLRDCIIWHKPNPMPSSVTDRTTTAHEYVFLLTKRARYFYDADAIREPITSTGGASVGKQNHDANGTGQQSRRFASPEERNNPLGRNKRSVWTIPTHSYHGAHFATFPPRLVEPMIRAATSERGCCPTCGAPWRRVVEKTHENPGNRTTNGPRSIERKHLDYGTAGFAQRLETRVVTVNWIPGCKCHAGEPVPCRVLDNFSGAGTTVMVADHLGRCGIGVELKGEYLAMSRERIAADRERRKNGKPTKVRKVNGGELLLFGVA